MAVSDLISIPGNIKQHFVPFVLNPANPMHTADPKFARSTYTMKDGDAEMKTALNKGATGDEKAKIERDINNKIATMHQEQHGGSYDSAKSYVKDIREAQKTLKATPQKFSFLPEPAGNSYDYGRLSICPNSFRNAGDNFSLKSVLKNDISYNGLYYHSSKHFTNNMNTEFEESFNFDRVLTDIPKVQVREYLQDAKINQIIGLFSTLCEGFSSVKKFIGNSEKDGLTIEDYADIALSSLQDVTANFGEKVMSPLLSSLQENIPSPAVYTDDAHNYANYVLKIPYVFYYRLMSSFTTNLYEFPYSGDSCYNSSGDGYKSKTLGDKMEENSIVGKLLNFANLNINVTPIWQGGADSASDSITIQFDLFNDTIMSSIMNMIFVNTLLPGNMWMQYHLFQHAPNLYDVRLDGFKRMFMCKGTFDCKYKGVMRRPSDMMKQRLLNRYINANIGNPNVILDNLRIPDIYSMTLTFTSLLPNNFNNFIYNFAYNDEIEAKELWQASAQAMLIPKITETLSSIWETNKKGYMQSDVFKARQKQREQEKKAAEEKK